MKAKASRRRQRENRKGKVSGNLKDKLTRSAAKGNAIANPWTKGPTD